jgi:hypothetical protein
LGAGEGYWEFALDCGEEGADMIGELERCG